MFTVVIFLCAFGIAYLAWRGVAQWAWRLSALLLILCLLLGSGVLAWLLLTPLQADYQQAPKIDWRKPSVIVLLTGGQVLIPESQHIVPGILAFARIVKTLELYTACQKAQAVCRIVVSGGDPRAIGRSEAASYREVLLAMGVPDTAIQCENRSDNTFQEAQDVGRFLSPTEQVLLVTSAFHLRRALLHFQTAHIDAIPIASDYLGVKFSVIPRAYNFTLADVAAHEYLGVTYAKWQRVMLRREQKSPKT